MSGQRENVWENEHCREHIRRNIWEINIFQTNSDYCVMEFCEVSPNFAEFSLFARIKKTFSFQF
jgi:hypothetical protein